jgi:hypothetical protein
MAEVLRSFEEPIRHASGAFHVRVVGRAAADGMWEGWLEFEPIAPGGGDTVISAVESRQPEREHLTYWAQGLSPIYAEGSLDRALHPIIVRTRVAEVPASARPARRVVPVPGRAHGPDPILDPFEIGARRPDILRQELHAIGRARLLNIIAAYDLNPGASDLASMSDEQLIGFIVAAVETKLFLGAD